jgi:hypothetical protein
MAARSPTRSCSTRSPLTARKRSSCSTSAAARAIRRRIPATARRSRSGAEGRQTPATQRCDEARRTPRRASCATDSWSRRTM